VVEEGTGTVVGARVPMPSRKHQRLVVLLTEHPQLFVELVRLCSGLDVPGDLELLPGPETVRFPTTERIDDGAVVVRRRDGGNCEAFVLEVQLEKDEEKRLAWPAYVVGTAARLRCPATLVVVTPSERVARWAAKPIDVGRGRMMLEPLVVGPRLIPTDPSLEEARARPDRFALSVIIHGSRPGSLRLGRMAMTIARELVALGDRRSIVLADLIVDSIGRDVRRTVQAEMEAVTGWGKTLWFSEIGKAVADGWADGRAAGRAEGKVEGKVEGKAEGKVEGKVEAIMKALWMVLRARKLEPTEEQRARIERCRNPRQLERWLQKALLATRMGEIFGR
jgi:hypothetical protein